MKKYRNHIVKTICLKKQMQAFSSQKPLKKLLNTGFIVCALLFMSSCEDFVKIDPPDTSLVGETVFVSDANAQAAVVGMYSKMNDSFTWLSGSSSMTVISGMGADEFLNYSSSDSYIDFFDNNISEENSYSNRVWYGLYRLIYSTNRVIEGLEASESVTKELSLQLEGEARFLRAFAYFLLVNLWGDVPLVLETDYQVNRLLPRTPVSEIYTQIIADFKEAQNLLPEAYVTDPFRTRVNKGAATAHLAKVYLYMEDWSNAEAEATALINDDSYELEEDLNDVFGVYSKEPIWQLENGYKGYASYEGPTFILTRAPRTMSLREELVDAFENDDKRSVDWVGSVNSGGQTYYFPYKYKIGRTLSGPPPEFLTLLRMGEQYLIRAEARAQQGEIDGAKADLNMIRDRAGLANTTADDQASILMAIEEERRFEFFAEVGHRWFDLKRTGRISTVLGGGPDPLKPGWEDTDALWPIPLGEILNNKNMTQNPGY